MFIVFSLIVLTGYLVGSIPTGYLFGKAKGIDLRKEGSGNIGATNALRVLGKKAGILVLLIDLLKGVAGCCLGVFIPQLLGMATEEIFVNIANYAYAPDHGKATVRVEVSQEPVTVTITFLDHGIPYDPLEKQDPDVSLSAFDRQIGGLGIFMTKKIMDDIAYE